MGRIDDKTPSNSPSMGRIERMVAELCPEGVPMVTLGEVCLSIKTGKLNANAKEENGQYPFYTCDAEPYRINTYAFDCEAILVTGNGSQVGHINYYKGKFNAYQRTYVLSKFDESINIFYALHYFKAYLKDYILLNSKKGSIPYITLPMLLEFQISLPPLPVQEAIVEILEKFDRLSAELQAELQARKQQYEYYRNQLLTRFAPDQPVTEYSLGELCEIGTGSHNTQDGMTEGDYPFYTRGIEILRLNCYDYDEKAVITAGDGAGVGKVIHYVDGKYALHQRAYRLVANESMLLPRYLYYYMNATFYDFIMRSSVSSSVTSVRRPMLVNYPIKLPSIEEQARIVAILDKFETLVNDLSQGLPAEIAAVQEQYEYYRNKLLTFKTKE